MPGIIFFMLFGALKVSKHSYKTTKLLYSDFLDSAEQTDLHYFSYTL